MEEIRCPGCMQVMAAGPICPHCGYDSRQGNASHQLPVGTVLQGRYQIGRVLGQGGFGITYLGWDLALKLPVAIKEYYPSAIVMRESAYSLSVSNCEGSSGTQFAANRDRFLREARSLARLAGVPQVVHVLGFFPENDTAYIVMEYVRGKTLKQALRDRGLMKPEHLEQVFGPLMAGLEKVHSIGLIHRDISPDNIMLLPDGGVKLLDFGAVREYDSAVSASTEAILKHGYAPLEQYQRRGEMGPWTDIYALCATIYFCLTGQVPPDAPERMLGGEDLRWDQIPGLSPRQQRTLVQGTRMPVRDRLSTVAALREGLWGDSPEEPPEEEDRKPPQPPVKKRVRPLWILLALLLAAGGWLLKRPAPPQPQATAPTTWATEAAETEPPVLTAVVRSPYASRREYVSDDFTVTVDNSNWVTVTLKGLTLEESYEVDLSTVDIYEQLFAWSLTLMNGDAEIQVSTTYYVPIRSQWKGQMTLRDMTTDIISKPASSEQYYESDIPVTLSWDSSSITWKFSVSDLVSYSKLIYPEEPLAFDPNAIDQFMLYIRDSETEVSTFNYYTVQQ